MQLEGLGLFLALAGMGVALIVWGRHLLDDGTAVEQVASRSPPRPSERRRRSSALARARRVGARTDGPCCGRMLWRRVGALGAALVFPFRSLGPQPTDAGARDSPWREGLRLVDDGAGHPSSTSCPRVAS